MKYLLLGLILLLSCSSQKKSAYPPDILSFQNELRTQFENPDTSPLKGEEFQYFKGITFFPIDLKYRVVAKMVPSEIEEFIEFTTSNNDLQTYKLYGKLYFQIDDEPLELTAYQPTTHDEYEDYLFIPYNDLTNGLNSYGGGRYIDLNVRDIQKESVVLDFNKSYNPYCAYSQYYSCPIPPANNYLNTEILAGVSYDRSH